MPLSQNPIVEWPPEFQHLLEDMHFATSGDGTRCGRTDIDVDQEVLFLLNVFEARVRHRHVRLRPAGPAECLVGEMNVLVGLGAAADPTRHLSRVRISFHDIQDDSCEDPAPQT